MEENKNPENISETENTAPIEEGVSEAAEEAAEAKTEASEDTGSEDTDTENTETEEEKEEGEKKGSLINDVLEIMESVVISIFIVLLGFTYVARPVTVEGMSMNNTLANADKLIMRTLFYTPECGDIVVIDNQNGHTFSPGTTNITSAPGLEKRIIKRVIAVGGQTLDIDFTTGTVTRDGKVLNEDYINGNTITDMKAFEYPITVPEGYVFVMGDNRERSADSRDPRVGFVSEEDILGKAILRFYPINKFGLI